jgi:hypothetical protein
MDSYKFLLWDDEAERLVTELEQQDVEFQMEFHLFVKKTTQSGWSRDEHLEVLDNNIETYALSVVPGDSRRLMLTRQGDAQCYWYLGITDMHHQSENVYRAACQAHRLVNPDRRKNEAKP